MEQAALSRSGSGLGLNRRLLIGVAVIILAMVYLLVVGLRDNMAYYLQVDELLARGAAVEGERVRMAGNIVEGSLASVPESLRYSFQLSQGGTMVPVTYEGTVPDIFGDYGHETNSQVLVIVEGELRQGVFHADVLQAQCPSRMQARLLEEKEAQQAGPAS